jgi:hypothetical protein
MAVAVSRSVCRLWSKMACTLAPPSAI